MQPHLKLIIIQRRWWLITASRHHREPQWSLISLFSKVEEWLDLVDAPRTTLVNKSISIIELDLKYFILPFVHLPSIYICFLLQMKIDLTVEFTEELWEYSNIMGKLLRSSM